MYFRNYMFFALFLAYTYFLLKHLDILCPFGFARMPKEDLKGLEAANLLQKVWTSRVLLWVLYFGREWRRAR